MAEFSKAIELVSVQEPEEPKWKTEGCPPSRVLFATNGRGAVSILDHVGPDASYLMSDSIERRYFIKNELKTHPFPGIWIWIGKVYGSRDYWGEYDEWTEGDVRPLTEDESSALAEEDDVWDRSLWLEEESK